MFDEIAQYLSGIGVSPGRGSYALAEQAEAYVQQVRSLLAQEICAHESEQISFTYNATHAINIVLKGLLTKKDHVVITNFDHNAVYRPVHKLSIEAGVEYDIWESDVCGIFNFEDLEKLLKTTTKLLVLNHASNVLGVVAPIKKAIQFAKERNIRVLLDVSQTAGLLPVHFGCDVDYIAGTGHKSLLGPSGIGFLYVKDSETLSTLYEGGSGYNSLSPFQPESIPDKYEAGTLNYVGVAGLYGSLCYLQEYGIETIRQQTLSLIEKTIEMLSTIPAVTLYGTKDIKYKVPLISFNVKNYFSSEVGYLLNQKGICVRTGLHCAPLMHQTLKTIPQGTVRVSLGHKNTYEEIEYLYSIISKL